MTEKSPPPPTPPTLANASQATFASPSRSETSSSLTKVDTSDLESGVYDLPTLTTQPREGPSLLPQSGPKRSWIQRFRMAYSRRPSRRPDSPDQPPPSYPPTQSHGHAPISISKSDYEDSEAQAGPSTKRVRLEIDTSSSLTAASYPAHYSPNSHISPVPPRPPFPTSQSALSTDESSSSDAKDPSMLILLREDYFSLRTFWRTADRRDVLRKLTARPMWSESACPFGRARRLRSPISHSGGGTPC